MVGMTKTLFRTALIGGIAVGGLTLLVGPDRMAAGATQARHFVCSWFDDNVQDPVVMRQQLRKLQEQYPKQIRELRGSIAEVDAEITALERDSEIAGKVVGMTKKDLALLGGLVDEAKVHLAADTGREVLVQFQGRNLSVNQAYDAAKRIRQTAVNYADRLAANERDLELLRTQRHRLSEQLGKLENEYSNFQNQVWQIERQIAAIERNENLIEMLEDREDVLAEQDRWQVKTLDQLSGQLARVQEEHEAILETLMNGSMQENYEDRAIGEALLQDSDDNPFEWTIEIEPQVRNFPQPPVIIDRPGASDDRTSIAQLDKQSSN
ncbi:MAG: hypothetical protein ACF8PN_13665 [Phycisphaerales bacterium]